MNDDQKQNFGDLVQLGGDSSTNRSCSTLNDPFQRENFEKMFIVVYNARECKFYDRKQFHAEIRFKAGMTSGEHQINADSMPELCEKIAAFSNELDARNGTSKSKAPETN